MERRYIFFLLFSLIFMQSTVVVADEIKPVKRVNPDYPERAINASKEGWVQMSFTIKPGGNVSDVVAIGSSDAVFEPFAVEAISKWKYDPAASQIGTQGTSYQNEFRFELDHEGQRVSKKFSSQYQVVSELLKSGKLDEAVKELKAANDLRHTNVDNMLFSWLVSQHYMAIDKRALAYEALKKATVMEDYIADTQYFSAIEQSITLAAENNKYVEAKTLLAFFRGSKKAKKTPTYAETQQKLTAIVAALEGKLGDGKELVVAGAVLDKYWAHSLNYREFSIGDVKGKLEKLLLNCTNNKRQTLEMKIDSGYKIPESWGKCEIFVKGDAGTSFLLAELPASSAER